MANVNSTGVRLRTVSTSPAGHSDSDVDMDEALRRVRQGGMSAADVAAHEAASYVRPTPKTVVALHSAPSLSARGLSALNRLTADLAYDLRNRQARESAARFEYQDAA